MRREARVFSCSSCSVKNIQLTFVGDTCQDNGVRSKSLRFKVSCSRCGYQIIVNGFHFGFLGAVLGMHAKASPECPLNASSAQIQPQAGAPHELADTDVIWDLVEQAHALSDWRGLLKLEGRVEELVRAYRMAGSYSVSLTGFLDYLIALKYFEDAHNEMRHEPGNEHLLAVIKLEKRRGVGLGMLAQCDRAISGASLTGQEEELSGKDKELASKEKEILVSKFVVYRLQVGWQGDAEAQARKMEEVGERAMWRETALLDLLHFRDAERVELERLRLEDGVQIRGMHEQEQRSRAQLDGKDSAIEGLRHRALEVPLTRILILHSFLPSLLLETPKPFPPTRWRKIWRRYRRRSVT